MLKLQGYDTEKNGQVHKQFSEKTWKCLFIYFALIKFMNICTYDIQLTTHLLRKFIAKWRNLNAFILDTHII